MQICSYFIDFIVLITQRRIVAHYYLRRPTLCRYALHQDTEVSFGLSEPNDRAAHS